MIGGGERCGGDDFERKVIARAGSGGRTTGKARPLLALFRFRWLEPQRREHRRAALNAQARLLDGLAVLLLRGFAFGAPEGLRHLHEIVALGLGDEAGESQQLAALFLRESGEVRAIRFDGAQYPQAGPQVVI